MTKTTRAKKGYETIAKTSPEEVSQRQKTVKSIKSKADEKRSFQDKIIDRGNSFFGSNIFLYLNIVWFVIWLVINLGHIPGIKPFDPFPFSFLTSSVSLEAIILAIFVLISQNRAAKIADLREEVELQISIMAEEENTKIMQMLVLLLQKNKIPVPEDKQLRDLLRKTDTQKIERNVQKQIDKS
jgi:uncharacterized membrane protein